MENKEIIIQGQLFHVLTTVSVMLPHPAYPSTYVIITVKEILNQGTFEGKLLKLVVFGFLDVFLFYFIVLSVVNT